MDSIVKIAGSIATLKCPKCREQKVFESKQGMFAFPKMFHNCTNCGYTFDREPGYFLGAMYASYGLAVFEGIVTFLLLRFLIPEFSAFGIALTIAGVIFLLAFWNYKLARVIWMNVFPG